MASRASGSGTPASSNITRPGLLTATAAALAPAARRAAATSAVAATATIAAGRHLLRRLDLRQVLREARRHDLALVDPDLHADPPERGARLEEAVVDVGAECVK